METKANDTTSPGKVNFASHTFYTEGDTLPADFPKELIDSDGLPVMPYCKVCGATATEIYLFHCEEYAALASEQKMTIRTNIKKARSERLHALIDTTTALASIANNIIQQGFNTFPEGSPYSYGTLFEIELTRFQVLYTVMEINNDLNQGRIDSYLPDAVGEYNKGNVFNQFPLELLTQIQNGSTEA